MAWGSALAIEPWLKDPRIRRCPFIRRYRAAQTVGVPTSHEKIASGAASSSIIRATYCGCIRPRTGSAVASSSQSLAHLPVMFQGRLQVSVVVLLGQPGEKRARRRLDVA